MPRSILSWWGVWDEIHAVSRPSSPNWAAEERGSIGQAEMRWEMTRPFTRTSLDASSCGSGFSGGTCRQMFVPTSGNRSTSSLAASTASVTAGSGS